MISVIIPSYNHEQYLIERIESVLDQTGVDIECIIIDDKSNDNSKEVINNFASKNNRIKCFFNEKNSASTFHQWNKGIGLANTEYIWIAESDDKADPELLNELLTVFKKNSDIVLAYCQSYRMNANSVITGSWKTYTDDLDSSLFDFNFIMDGKEFIERFLIHKNVIPNASAVLFKKSVYDQIGGASEHLKTNGDWLTWLKMLCYGKVAFIAKPMNYFRYHNSSVIAKAFVKHDPSSYREWFDFSMRKEFILFSKLNQIQLTEKIKKINNLFIANELGNKGLFLLKRKKTLDGWFHIIKATFYSAFQTGFIKRAFFAK